MKFPTLYQKAKTGTIVQWSIWTKGNKIYKEYGNIGGKLQQSNPTVCIGKNIGKSNETTPVKQAEVEAKAEWDIKLAKKYSISVEDAGNDTRHLPLLAKDVNWKKITYPVMVQPKFNGLRAIARWEDGHVVLVSRGNKRYTLPHITNFIEGILKPGSELDGEIYLHGATLQEINRRVKKYRPGKTEELNYHVYDTPMAGICSERITWISEFFEENVKEGSIIKLAPTVWMNSMEEILEFEKKCVIGGYEGAIIRIPDGLYEYGKRSSKLLKVKSFKDDEFEIVGFEEGVGKNAGCVTWHCLAKNGEEFSVVPKGTYSDKKYWYDNAASFIGEKLVVRYFDLSEKGIPTIATGVAIRLPEDMDEEKNI